MYVIKMMSGEKFLITEEEMRGMSGKSGLYPIPSLKGLINLSSISCIIPEYAEDNEPKNGDTRICLDGTRVIYKFGSWVLESNTNAKMDLKYYPELKLPKSTNKFNLEEPSKFAKQVDIKEIE